MRKQMKFIIHIPPTILRSYCDHIEIYREHCHYKIIPKKATLKHFPGRLQVSSTSFVSSSCISSPSTCQSQTGGAGVGSLANTVARAPDDLTTARIRPCWRVCARVKMAIRLVCVVAMTGFVDRKNARDCRRACQSTREIAWRAQVGEKLRGASGRRAGGRIPQRATHREAPLTPEHSRTRTTSTTANLRLLHGPGAAASLSSCTSCISLLLQASSA
jgi:hypothetical protein